MHEENVIYVGRKPVMNYVLAVMNSLKQKGLDEVVLKARGRAISTAVDAAEVTRRYVKDLEAAVSIGTEQLPREEGGTRNVSTMEITMKRSRAAEDKTQEEVEEPEKAAEEEKTEKKGEEPEETEGFGYI
jgi:DNA-binding protein